MTLNQLVSRVASAYPDAQVLQYWDMHNQKPCANARAGDTLAWFVVQEIYETYAPLASENRQIATAAQVIQNAADTLADVAQALSEGVRAKA
jgi:hypothetical protein